MPTPIVLLPGIMGSRLYFPNSGKYWDPDSAFRMLRWLPIWPFRSDDDNRHDLHASETAGVIFDKANGIKQDQMIRGWSTVAWKYYGPMLTALQNEFNDKTNVYAVGYDWRQDIQTLGDYVASKINGIRDDTGADQVLVITHSMGGLVFRSALISGALDEAHVKGLIHVCIPAAGAVILYRRLFTGLVQGLDGDSGVADSAFRLLLGNNRKGFLGNFSGLPGAVELLPSEFLPPDWNDELNGMSFADLYPDPSSPPGAIPPASLGLASDVIADLQERLQDLKDFQKFFGDPAHALGPETWSIYGIDKSTETHISFSNGVAVPGPEPSGDGTVPPRSAMSLELDTSHTSFTPVEHAMACTDSVVQNKVIAIATPLI